MAYGGLSRKNHYLCFMYKSIRFVRIIISLVAMVIPAWALLCGYESVFVRMRVFTSLLSGVGLCLVFWAIVTLIYGRIYCSTVCPLGTLMDCVSNTRRVVCRSKSDYRYTLPSPRTRIVFLVAAIIALVGGSVFLPTLFDPYSAYSRMIEEFFVRPFGRAYGAVSFSISSFSVAVVTALGIVAASWRRGRLVCNTVCPVGTVLGVGSKRSYFHIEIDPDKCINCGKCESVCKAQCIKLPEKTVDASRCVVCFNCTTVCPNQAINYKSGRYHIDMPMLQNISQGSAAQTSTPK